MTDSDFGCLYSPVPRQSPVKAIANLDKEVFVNRIIGIKHHGAIINESAFIDKIKQVISAAPLFPLEFRLKTRAPHLSAISAVISVQPSAATNMRMFSRG